MCISPYQAIETCEDWFGSQRSADLTFLVNAIRDMDERVVPALVEASMQGLFPAQIIHGDLHYDNVLEDATEEAAGGVHRDRSLTL